MRARSPVAFVLALVALTGGLVACGSSAPSFDPTGTCTTDGSAPGSYPDLEALIPTAYLDRTPDTLDSGRNCTAENLGSLASAGITEVRFAGGTWGLGANRAAALVVFQASGLTVDAVADFYTASARAADRTTVTGESQVSMAGQTVRRMDSSTGDRTQTVVVWPAAEPDTVNIVLTNDLPDARIEDAVAAFARP
jgi:hypothetical protein